MADEDSTSATAGETDAMAHAWNWFVVHAAQRMQGVNYFLIAIALVVAGYGATFASKNYAVAVAAGVLGVRVTYTFWMLDRRTRQLIKASEVPLAVLQERLADRSGIDSLRILKAVGKPAKWHLTYSAALRVLMVLVMALMLVSIIVALGAAIGFIGSPWVPAPIPAPTPSHAP